MSAGFPHQRVKPDARSTIMNFGLLLSNLPHIDEARVHHDAMLSLEPRGPHRLATFWHRLKALIS
jgi:hypothetical protein